MFGAPSFSARIHWIERSKGVRGNVIKLIHGLTTVLTVVGCQSTRGRETTESGRGRRQGCITLTSPLRTAVSARAVEWSVEQRILRDIQPAQVNGGWGAVLTRLMRVNNDTCKELLRISS